MATTMTPAEMATAVDRIVAEHNARVARIAASDYRGRVELRKGFDQITITIEPAAGNVSWEVAGVGIYLTTRGGQVGDTARKFFGELDGAAGARAYANGWVAELIAKGYRRTA
jgi:hypothetical protein